MVRLLQTVLLLTILHYASTFDILAMVEVISGLTMADLRRYMDIADDAVKKSLQVNDQLQHDFPLYNALTKFRSKVASLSQDEQDFITLMFRVARKRIDGEPGDLTDRLVVKFDRQSVRCSPFFLQYKDTQAFKYLYLITNTVCPSRGAESSTTTPPTTGSLRTTPIPTSTSAVRGSTSTTRVPTRTSTVRGSTSTTSVPTRTSTVSRSTSTTRVPTSISTVRGSTSTSATPTSTASTSSY